jgi:hypothetical protein
MSGSRFKRLEPFAKYYYEMSSAVFRMTTPDLRRLRDAIDRTTETNCSWAVYRAAQHLRTDVHSQLRMRNALARRKGQRKVSGERSRLKRRPNKRTGHTNQEVEG